MRAADATAPPQTLACPACGATARQIGGGATGFETVIQGRVFVQPSYIVASCDACGLCTKSATIAPTELEQYYALLDSATFETEGWFPTDAIVRRRLMALPDQSRVLDYGCSQGRILQGLAPRLRCFGVEPNAAAAAVARARGVEILPEGILGTREQEFDAILLTDVYEHLVRPVQLIEQLARCLAPEGWIGIVTGNADAVTTRDRLAEFWYFRVPGHLVMAGEHHVRWLADRVGLNVAALYKCSHYDTPTLDCLTQLVRSFAYERFRRRPRGLVTALLRLTPLRRAEDWTTAPALTCGADHLVVFLERAAIGSDVEHPSLAESA